MTYFIYGTILSATILRTGSVIMYKLLLILLFLCLTIASGCTDNTSPRETPSPEEPAQTTTANPATEGPTLTAEPTKTSNTESIETPTAEPVETTATEPVETTATEPAETTTTEPAETTTTEPASTTTLPETRIYKNDDFYYQMSIPYTCRINKEDIYNVFISAAIGDIYVHIDRLTVDESAGSYFNSIVAGENEKITHLISEPGTEITENDVISGYEFDCSNLVDGANYIGRGMVLKKGSFVFFVSFTSMEANWEENKEITTECLESFTLPPIYTNSYTNSELGISLNLPANWSLIDTGSKSTPIEIFCCTGFYVERLDMSWMQHANGKLIVNTVQPGTTAKEYLAMKSDGATQTPFIFTNSAVGSEYSMALRANDEVIAVFKYIALVIGSKVYYFEFLGVPDMNTLEDSVTEIVSSLVISTE